MDFKDLSPELREKAKACKTPEMAASSSPESLRPIALTEYFDPASR